MTAIQWTPAEMWHNALTADIDDETPIHDTPEQFLAAYFTACLALALLVVWPCVEAWGRWER